MDIPSPDWRTVKELFLRARELTLAERDAFLAEACIGNETRKRDVESLLAEDAADPAFLEHPLDVAQMLTSIGVDRIVGAYRLTEVIGRGGMGTVYAAVRADDAYQRQVAIKVVNRGMDTEDVIQRFHAERQTLARLDHPNIARIIDGGTTEDGLPYFVMDYVDGQPIDVYCDTERLTIPDRIDLFRIVCGAVSYAHQNLIVHRDLKPENILVTRAGVPKLLDFGVAKLLDPDEGDATPKVTRLLDRRMTLSHASPEQVRGLPITTASDVYSLGVVLYTLLSGHHPYRVSGVSTEEAARTICEITARPLATWLESPRTGSLETLDEIAAARSTSVGALRRELASDLERIVAMTLRKEPQRRYASVELLSEDLHRYLRGLPVRARADTVRYRALTFVKRHRVGVIATAVAIVSLIGGTAASVWQASEARAERQIAERRLSDVRKLANSLLFEIHDAIASLPGSTRARELLVSRGLEYLDALAAESAGDRSLQLELANAYQRIGDVQGNPTNANLGDMAAAEASYNKGLAIAERLNVDGDWQAARQLAALHQRTGDMRAYLGDPAGAVAAMRRALTIYKGEASAAPAIAAAPPGDSAVHLLWAVSHIKLGDVQGNPDFPNAGDAASATANYEAALPIVAALPDEMRTTKLRYLGLLHERLGRMSEARGAHSDALAQYHQSLAFREQWSALEPTHFDARRDLAIGHEKIGSISRLTGDLPGALAGYRTANAIFNELAAADPNNANALRSVAINQEKIGDVLAEAGDRPAAEREYRAALDIHSRLAARAPGNVQARRDIVRVTESLSRLK